MEKPRGYDNIETNDYSSQQKIEAGGYVCRIMKAVVQEVKGYKIWNILFDVVEGEFKDYYKKDFEEQKERAKQNQNERSPKWKGVYKIFLPLDDEYGTEKYERAVRTQKAFITSVEHSNDGYHWNWDGNTLVNKLVGLVFGLEEWSWNGKSGWTAKPRYATGVKRIRDNDFNLPKPKELKGGKKNDGATYAKKYAEQTTKPQYTITDDDLPF